MKPPSTQVPFDAELKVLSNDIFRKFISSSVCEQEVKLKNGKFFIFLKIAKKLQYLSYMSKIARLSFWDQNT